MEGFQQTFTELYGGSNSEFESTSASGNQTCGSGNGAGSDALLVSWW